MSSFKCRSNVHETILPKKMFGCPLKFILGLFRSFYIYGYKPKYFYTIMYECENSPFSYELFKIGLFIFSHLIFVSSKCYLQKVAPQKSWNIFSLFLEP
jgi:hypothetical protein